MNTIVHPSEILPAETVRTIRRHTAAAERAGELLPPQLQIIEKEKWFRLFVPEQYDGLALHLPQAVQLEEALAWTDGSLGWVVTLCAGAAMFVGYFDQSLVDEIFSQQQVCLAGSGQAGGTADITADGFVVNGYWPYASGTPHATHFTANCQITRNGKKVLQADGSPLIRSFVFRRDEVQLHANWKYTGLQATGGHAYSVQQLHVPSNRTFTIGAAYAQLPHPVYRYPFLQLAEATLSANISGMCMYFIDLAEDLLHRKNTSQLRSAQVKEKGLQLLEQAKENIHVLRQQFYGALINSWQQHIKNGTITQEQLHAVSSASLALAQDARQWTDRIYPYCGLEAAHSDSPINQVWRNIHTASQHSLLLM